MQQKAAILSSNRIQTTAPNRNTTTNDQILKQTEEFFAAATKMQLPNGVQDFAQESLAKTHETVKQVTKATANSQKVREGVVDTYSKGAKSLNKKVNSLVTQLHVGTHATQPTMAAVYFDDFTASSFAIAELQILVVVFAIQDQLNLDQITTGNRSIVV